MDTQENVESLTVAMPEKSIKTAYVLLILSGLLGAHRMYLGRWASGFTYLVLFFVAIFALDQYLIYLLMAGLCIDLFLLPGITKKCNARIAQEFADHPERFALLDNPEIAPWARLKQPGFFYKLKTPVRILQFIVLPAIFTLIMVMTQNFEFVVFPVIILVATGLITSLDEMTIRYPAILNLPGIEPALARTQEMRQYYWDNEPRLSGSILGMFTRARTEYAPYWKIVGLAVVAIVIDTVFSFEDDYLPYLGVEDAILITISHIFIIGASIFMILSPMSALSYHYSLSGKKIRLRVLTIAALFMVATVFYFGNQLERESGEVSLFSSQRLELRMEKENFRASLSDNVSMFITYYGPVSEVPDQKDKLVCDSLVNRNTCEPTAWLRELLKGIAPNDENESFEIVDINIPFAAGPPYLWRGVRYKTDKVRRVIAATDGEVLCRGLDAHDIPSYLEGEQTDCDSILLQFINLPDETAMTIVTE